MLSLLKIFLALLLMTGLINAAAWAQMPLPLPVPRNTTPQWTPIPGAPGVEHAPNINADLLRHGQGYYYQHNGKWYQGTSTAGPWHKAKSIPPAFYQIQAPYFKQPPGWAKGKKTGWGGAPMPPGQMKKSGDGPHITPGHMK